MERGCFGDESFIGKANELIFFNKKHSHFNLHV